MKMNDDEVLLTIKWTVADVRAAFVNKYGRQPTDGQLQDSIENIDLKGLENYSIENGWYFIDNAVI